jgi:hypothetical protein
MPKKLERSKLIVPAGIEPPLTGEDYMVLMVTANEFKFWARRVKRRDFSVWVTPDALTIAARGMVISSISPYPKVP